MTFASANTDSEQEIIDFVSAQLAIKASQIALSSELNNDLGMDGDDAAEFFDAFAKRFRVDIDELNIHWDMHFVPEGGPGPSFQILVGAAVIASIALHEIVPTIPFWLSCLVILPLAIFGYFYVAGRNSRKAAGVTVQDLIDAAKAHRWVKRYDTGSAVLTAHEL